MTSITSQLQATLLMPTIGEDPKASENSQQVTDKQIVSAARSIFKAMNYLPLVIQDEVMDFIFTDITRIYETAGIHFTYIPKQIMQNPDEEIVLTAREREGRVRSGRDNILSRMVREFEHSQDAMKLNSDKAFKYMKAPIEFPRQEVVIGKYSVGISSIQGHRNSMEDRHIVKEIEFNLFIGGRTYRVPLFAVFDGHGGRQAAEYGSIYLQEVLEDTLREYNSDSLLLEGIWNALKLTCVNLNERYRESGSGTVGSTVLFAIELCGMTWIVNVGDSRAIFNNVGTFIQLSEDANPTTPRFEKGITNRGGKVVEGRIDGDLAVGRAIGDGVFGNVVSARSKITMLPTSFIKPGSDLVLGCDGNFDVASTWQILLADLEYQDVSPGQLAANFVFSAFDAGSEDNITVVLIRFLGG